MVAVCRVVLCCVLRWLCLFGFDLCCMCVWCVLLVCVVCRVLFVCVGCVAVL